MHPKTLPKFSEIPTKGKKQQEVTSTPFSENGRCAFETKANEGGAGYEVHE